MKKLTETLIQQRLKTCTTDLDKVQQINITGRDLQDVSLLKKLTGVEILSLSVNKISSLADFQNLKNLKELYLRHNNISDINQIFFLRNLPKLELLMLSENPCAVDPLYRVTVIKNIKTLTELDGISISSEERKEAVKSGKEVFVFSDAVDHLNNCIPDGPQIQRTPTQSAQKLRSMENNMEEILQMKTNFEVVNEDDDAKVHKIEETNLVIAADDHSRDLKTQSTCETCSGKGIKPTKTETKAVPGNWDQDMKVFRCTVCNTNPIEFPPRTNREMHCVRQIPKNSHILSAVLSLVKELDFSGLQIVNAEVMSRLNTFQVDLLYHTKP